MKKHIFISATRHKKEETTIYKCHQRSISFNAFPLEVIENNICGLSQLYNTILQKYKNEYDYIHFVHDDVWIYDDTGLLIQEIEQSNYDISGVAGAGRCKISYPSGWYDMAVKADPYQLRGHIEHKLMDKQTSLELQFSKNNFNDRCVIVDGVYMCVKTTNLQNWKFNENYKFHHYDLASCIDAIHQNLKVGVVNLHLRHELRPRPAITADPIWIESDKKFREEYVKYTNNK